MSDDTKESISDDTEEKGNEINTEDSDHSLDLGSISSLLGPKCAVNIDQLIDKSKEELIDTCKQMNLYIEFLHQKNSSGGIHSFQEYQKREKLLRDSSYREKILLRRLAVKEHEIQEYIVQLKELKAAQIPSVANLKTALLDPAVNVIFQKLKAELIETREKLEETQNELNAWKFTPDSNTGKRLMAKCRLLHQENEELGKIISSGRVAKLEGELALQKSFSEEIKKSQCELDDLLQDLDEDVEGMQGTIYYLQQELKKSNEIISNLQNENGQLRQRCTQLSNVNSTDSNDNEKYEDTVLSQQQSSSSTVNSVDDSVVKDESEDTSIKNIALDESADNNSNNVLTANDNIIEDNVVNDKENIMIIDQVVDKEITENSEPQSKKLKVDEVQPTS